MSDENEILDEDSAVEIDLPDETETPALKKNRRMSDADFAAAKELYELGAKTMVELVDQFKVSRQTLSKRFRDAGVTYGSRSHEVATETAARVINASASAAATFEDLRPERLEETRQQGFQLLKQAKLVGQKIVADALRAGDPLERVDGDLKALGRYVKIQVDLLDSTMSLLRADEFQDEEDLPNFTIQDLTLGDVMEHIEQSSGPDAADPTNINIDALEDAS